jgi:hypothetical protein
VCPQIKLRLTSDGLLEHGEELSDDEKLIGLFGMKRDRNEVGDIVSSLCPTHVHIENGVVHHPHDPLPSGEHRCVLIEKIKPQVDIVPFWGLVADIPEHIPLVLFLQPDNSAEGVSLFHAKSFVRIPQFEEKAVHGLASESVIDQSCYGFRMSFIAKSSGGEPFPVAVMTKDSGTVLSSVEGILQPFKSHKVYMFEQVLIRDAQQLEGFKEVVAEPAIEFTFDRLDFLLTFLRKGIAEVLPHDFPPVSCHIIYNDEKKVRQSIQHPEREDGQEINKSVNYIIHYL